MDTLPHNHYADAYNADYDFEQHLVAARQRHLQEQLEAIAPSTVLEVGCGNTLLIDALPKCSASTWWIVEPADAFAAVALDGKARHLQLHVAHSTLEGWTEPRFTADLVILSSLLHEIDDLDGLFAAVKQRLAPNGQVLINVPNGLSLHRQLACAMGLIQDVTDLSQRNHTLAQRRVFTLSTLTEYLAGTGFNVVDSGGYFIKPFTHKQMALCLPHLPENVLEGMYVLGENHPELASEIWVAARFS